MKSFTLTLLRLSTGLLLVLWGVIKIGAPEVAIDVSDRYYEGLLSGADIQVALGAAEVGLGVLVCLGLFRRYVYPIQAIVLGLGLAFIWQQILDPLGLFLLDETSRRPLFFPSLCVFAASLILIVFRDEDKWSLDGLFRN